MVMMFFVYGEGGPYIENLINKHCFDGSMSGAENALFSMKGEFDAFGLVEIIQGGLEAGAAFFKIRMLTASEAKETSKSDSVVSSALDLLEVFGAASGLFLCLRPAISSFQSVLDGMDDSTCSAAAIGVIGMQMTPCIYTSCVAPKIAVTFSGGARHAPGLGAGAAVVMLMGLLWT